ncbi:MAG: hypothetical protein FD165_1321 [Gammaproteobacteria bacterium]|nr:MAG: hypothetical protein FD165_1321 [Gammaproteobacteria bacterium]TND05820.1 MAG: hypothetical protein FD120_1033 [Gammaproteobacteria bacterium]
MRVKDNARPQRMLYLFPLLLFLCASSTALAASVADATFWTANGPVYATATDSTKVYLGGDFNYVGPVTGAGAAVKLVDGTGESNMPKIEGVVHVVVPDGAGGWYIGGQFTSVGGSARSNIAHIGSSKVVSALFNPGANGTVFSLVLSGDLSTLYVGGDFTVVGGQTRRRLAAITPGNGIVVPGFNPGMNGAVRTLALSPGDSTLYAGGEFTTVNSGTVRNRLAAFAVSTGTAVAGFDPNMNGAVRSLAIKSDGVVLYAGGDFTSVNGVTARNRLAAFTTVDGLAAAFNPNSNGSVYTLALTSDDATLYAGGEFTDLNAGTTRSRLAALATATGTAAAGFDPDVNGSVRTIRLSADESVIYSGGEFTSVNAGTTPAARLNIAAFATADGSVNTTVAPHAGDVVRSLALSSTLVFFGGDFNSIGGKLRDRLAALTIADGTATDWNPGANNTVRALVLTGNSSALYAGGDFTVIGGASRNRLAGLDTAVNTSNALAWNPDASATVHALTLAAADAKLYVAGEFTSFNATATVRNRLARFDVASNTPDSWNPDANAAVYTLALKNDGSTLFVGGDFTGFNASTVTRTRMAALNTADANATVWDQFANLAVRSLALSPDGRTAYAGGDFTDISGRVRNHLASLGTSPPVGTEWASQTSGTSRILLDVAASSSRFVAIGESGTILVSNDGIEWELIETGVPDTFKDVIFTGLNQFVTVGEDGFVITSQNGSSWTPRNSGTSATLNGVIWGVGGSPDPILVVVGSGGTVITSVDGVTWKTQTSATGNTLNAVAVSGVDTASGQGIGFVAVGDSGTIITSEDGVTWAVEASGTSANLNAVVWSGSEFVAVGDNGTALTRTNNDLDSWIPAVSVQTTHSLRNVAWGLSKYVAVGDGGTIITSSNGSSWIDQTAVTGERLSGIDWGQNLFVAVGDNGTVLTSTKNDEVNGWAPEANGTVRALAVSSDEQIIYAGGDFSTIAGVARQRLAGVDTVTSEALDWSPALDGPVFSLSFIPATGTLFAGGSFYSIGNETRSGFAAFDLLPPATTVSPDPGVGNTGYYKEAQTITLTCADGSGSGCADIYASIDGSDPPISAINRYTEPVSITTNTTLKYRAVDKVGNAEAIQTREYVIDVVAPETKAVPECAGVESGCRQPGELVFYADTLLVALTCTDNAGGSGCSTGGTFYTTDGSAPTILSKVYTGPIAIRTTTTLKFFSVDVVGNLEQPKQHSYVKGSSGIGSINPLFLLLAVAGIALRLRRRPMVG